MSKFVEPVDARDSWLARFLVCQETRFRLDPQHPIVVVEISIGTIDEPLCNVGGSIP